MKKMRKKSKYITNPEQSKIKINGEILQTYRLAILIGKFLYYICISL